MPFFAFIKKRMKGKAREEKVRARSKRASVLEGRQEEVAKLLEWSGKDGVETLRIFLLYGRCFA